MKAQERSYFNSFRDVVRAVSSTLDVKEVLSLLVNNVAQVMNLKACAIRLLNTQKRTLELVASSGLSNSYISKGPVDADQSVAEAMKGEIVCISNASEDSRAQYPQQANEEGIVGIVSVPLSLKGQVIGVLRLYTGEPREFAEEELQFAEALGEMGAIAIENARMYERIKQDYESVMSDIYNFVGYRRSI
jgi:signal transduction protein with GAF and PtsI domain